MSSVPPAGLKKDLAAEIAQLEQMLASDPKSARFYELADSYTRAGRYHEATTVCRRGLTLHPQSAPGFLAMGRALFGIGRLPVASEALRRAIQLAPQAPEGYRLLAELFLRRQIFTEAVALLEHAVELGVEDRKLQRLLTRALEALESQATTVTAVPDEPRGIGNMAVAGTIGGLSGDLSLEEEDDDDILIRRHAADPNDESGPLALRAFRPREGESKVDWATLEEAWEARLDAQRHERLVTDPDVPLGAAAVGVALLPLSDPLAEGMPPLPDSEELESPAPTAAPSAMPAATPLARIDEDEDEARTAVRSHPGGSEEEETAVRPHPDPLTLAPPRSLDVLAAARAEQQVARAEEQAARAEQGTPHRAEPMVAPQRRRVDPTLPRRDRAREPLVAVEVVPSSSAPSSARSSAPQSTGPQVSSGRDLDAALLADFSAPSIADEPSVVVQEATEFISSPPPRRSSVGRWILTILLLAALGGGAFVGWRVFEGRRRGAQAIDFAGKARRAGTTAALAAAQNELDRAIALATTQKAELEAERQLLRALAWSWQRAGTLPTPPAIDSGSRWSLRARAAALALARGEPEGAGKLLGPTPKQAGDRPLHLLLEAGVAWGLGDVPNTEQRLGQALRLDEQLAPARLARGNMLRVLGYLEPAEQAFRTILEAHPRHRLAAVGLAAVLLQKDPQSAELVTLLAPVATDPPLAASWRAFLRAERRLLRGEKIERSALSSVAAAAPADRDLLAHMIRTLASNCAFGAAQEALGRLGPARSDDALRTLLAAEVAWARGLDSSARSLPAAAPRQRQLKAWALLQVGKHAAALKALGDDRSAAAEPLRVLADGLGLLARRQEGAKSRATLAAALKQRVLEPLAVLGRRAGRAQLARIALLLRLGRKTEALSAAKALRPGTAVGARAAVLVASSFIEQPRRVVDLLAATSRRCVGYLPALELEGRALLAMRRGRRALLLLRRAHTAGYRKPSTLLALSRAVLRVEKNVATAAALLGEARTAQPAGGTAQALAQAELLLVQGQGQAAISVLKTVPHSVEVLLLLARAHRLSGEIGAALAALEQAQKRAPDQIWVQLERGDLLLHQGKKRDAAGCFERARRLAAAQPRLPSRARARARVGLAELHLLGRRRKLALRELQAAVTEDATFGRAYRLLGQTQLALRARKAARASLKKAAELSPRDASTQLLLAQAIGRGAAAKRAYQRFLQLEPQGARAKKVRRLLRRWRR